MGTSALEFSSTEKIATDETSSRSFENMSNVEGVFSERKKVVKSSGGGFCSEEKTAGNETSSSSIKVISDEEPPSDITVVKLTSEEKTINETSMFSIEIIPDDEEPPSESSSIESPDPIQKGRESFEHLNYEIEITEDLISSLLKRFKKNQYNPSSIYGEDCDIISNCIYLFKKSYSCKLIHNNVGKLCYN